MFCTCFLLTLRRQKLLVNHSPSCFKSLSIFTDLTPFVFFFSFYDATPYLFAPGLLPRNLWNITGCDPEESCKFATGYSCHLIQNIKAYRGQSNDITAVFCRHTQMRLGITNNVSVATEVRCEPVA